MLDVPLLLEHLNSEALPCWPVTWGVPLPVGALHDVDRLVVVDARGLSHEAQGRALVHHDDGSVARLLVHAEVPVPADQRTEWRLRHGTAPASGAAAAVEHDAIRGAAGVLRLADEMGWHTIQGEYALRLLCRARPVSPGHAQPALADLVWRLTHVEPFERGPVVAAAIVHGTLGDDRGPMLHLRLTVRLFRQTPVMFCEVWCKNLSDHAAVEVESLSLRLVRRAGAWSAARYEVRQIPRIADARLPLRVRSGKLRIDIDSAGRTSEHTSRLLNYNETWFSAIDEGAVNADARPAAPRSGQLVLGVRNFFECFPYGVAIEPEAITVELWPSGQPQPWRIAQGSGKTHALLLAPLPGDSRDLPRAIGYAFGKPPLPRVPLATMQQAGAMVDLLEYDPDRYPRIETALYDLAYNRNRGLGKLNHGDDYSVLYTNQLRGAGSVVWNNLEGDYPYHMLCQFQRTGRYLYFKELCDSLQHWLDVDFCDRSDDPLRQGALIAHSAEHHTGGASPCHNWAQGIAEWHLMTGDPRAREVLALMADWLLRQDQRGFFHTTPEPYVRGCGWGLIQAAAMWQVLRRDDLRRFAERLIGELLAYCRARHGLVMTMPTGGTWTPRDNAFHTATVVMGAYEWWKLRRESAMRDLALTAAEAFMDQRTATPEGIAVYITGPEQDFPMQQAAGFAMAALAVAHRLTGAERYVRRGMRMLEYCLDRGMILDHMRIPGRFIELGDEVVLEPALLMPNTQLLSYQMRGVLMFMRAAHEAGMLKAIDYQF